MPSEDRRTFPIRLGAIDIGSNAMRMLAAGFRSATALDLLDQLRVPVRLGHAVFLTGQLTDETMSAAIAALQLFRRRLSDLGIEQYRAVATSAVRDSSNGAILFDAEI